MIKNKLLFSAILTLCITTGVGTFANPIKTYNLYADTHRKDVDNALNGNYERGMSDYYSKYNNNSSNSGYNSSNSPERPQERRRNEILRESSQRTFADYSIPPAWTQGRIYYDNPTLSSIQKNIVKEIIQAAYKKEKLM